MNLKVTDTHLEDLSEIRQLKVRLFAFGKLGEVMNIHTSKLELIHCAGLRIDMCKSHDSW